ncbi:FAR1-related sequence 3, partial [Prunus dulcis]
MEVLACLRSLIRKWVHENFTGDDLLKLFPPDLPLDLQSSLVVLFHKYQSQWKDEVAREQLLQDYTKSPLDEIEVKFQLTRDTLEAMLRSLTYIKEQLSSMGRDIGMRVLPGTDIGEGDLNTVPWCIRNCSKPLELKAPRI